MSTKRSAAFTDVHLRRELARIAFAGGSVWSPSVPELSLQVLTQRGGLQTRLWVPEFKEVFWTNRAWFGMEQAEAVLEIGPDNACWAVTRRVFGRRVLWSRGIDTPGWLTFENLSEK